MSRSSVMERDIGPHEHQMVVYLSYEIYAVCTKCGYHDWSSPSSVEADVESSMIAHFKAKYPNARVERL